MANAMTAIMGFLSALAGWTNDNLGGRIMRPFIEKAIHALSAQGAKLSAKAVITELGKIGFSPETIRNSALFKYAAPTLLTAGAGALNVKVPESVFGGDIRQAKELEGFLNNVIDRAGEGASVGVATAGTDPQSLPGIVPGTMVYAKAHNMPGLAGYRHLAIQGNGDQVSTVCSAVDEFLENEALRGLVMRMGLRRLDSSVDASSIEPAMTYHLPQEVDHLPDCPHCLGKLMMLESDALKGPDALETLLSTDEKRKWAAIVRHVAAHEHRVAMMVLKRGRVAILKQLALVDVLKLALEDVQVGAESFRKDGKDKVLAKGVTGAEHDPTGNAIAPSVQGVIDVLYLMDEVKVDGVTEWRQLLDESVDGNWWQARKRQAVQFVANHGAFGLGVLAFFGGLAIILILGVEFILALTGGFGEINYIASWAGSAMIKTPLVTLLVGIMTVMLVAVLFGVQGHLIESTLAWFRNLWPSLDEAIDRLPPSLKWLKSKRGEAEVSVVYQPTFSVLFTYTFILAHVLLAIPILAINLTEQYTSVDTSAEIARWILFLAFLTLIFWQFSAVSGAIKDERFRRQRLDNVVGWSRFTAFLFDSTFSSAKLFQTLFSIAWAAAMLIPITTHLIQPIVAGFEHDQCELGGTASSVATVATPGFIEKLSGVPGSGHLAVFIAIVVFGLIATAAAILVRNRVGKVALWSMTGLSIVLFLAYFVVLGPVLTVGKQLTDVGHGDGFFEAATYDWMYPNQEDQRRAERTNTVPGYTTTPTTVTSPVVSNSEQPRSTGASDSLKKAREELAAAGY